MKLPSFSIGLLASAWILVGSFTVGCGAQSEITVTETVEVRVITTEPAQTTDTSPLLEPEGAEPEGDAYAIPQYRFQSPTGNLKCTAIDATAYTDPIITCLVDSTSTVIAYSPGTTALLTEVSGIPEGFRGAADTIEYGGIVELSNLVCESSEIGIQCYSLDDLGDGFRISREGVVLFQRTALDSMSSVDARQGTYEFPSGLVDQLDEVETNLDPQFATCADAISAGFGPYVIGDDPEYDWYRDQDSDGVVCE